MRAVFDHVRCELDVSCRSGGLGEHQVYPHDEVNLGPVELVSGTHLRQGGFQLFVQFNFQAEH